ncbi:hypothetical protein [Sulfurovum sp.]|jgi:hypothetical protein|uniref:hypothetical protein n=1 Tax=Sulfurovum sp. TaxID=1969726 RepID=UPI002A364085|nr:hypothetical protein [Sulfurovum sp.]
MYGYRKTMQKMTLVFLFCMISVANAGTWIEQRYVDKSAGNYDKELYLKEGNFPQSEVVENLNNPTLLYRYDYGEVFETDFDHGKINVNLPYKGSYHLFIQERYVEDSILHIKMYKTRVYNSKGNIEDSLIKEIRGKTVGSHFGKEPFEAVTFEAVLQKPIKQHHINCCVYSGDIVPIKVYFKQKQLKNTPIVITTQQGWEKTVNPDSDGLLSFEIPRNTYADISKNKRFKEQLLIEAFYEENKSGIYKKKPYKKIKYYLSIPLSFHTSPLEYTSKSAGFYVVISVIAVFSLGLYYYRRKKKKIVKEIWFEED